MLTGIWITLWVILVIVLLFVGLGCNLLGLGGNWIMAGTMIAHRFLMDPQSRLGVSWALIAVLLIISIVAEVIEFVSGVKGAGNAGASRRAMVLSMIGSLFGAGVGLGIGNAIVPILGGILGVVFFGALGALGGAVLGETWKGKDLTESMEVGRGAFSGRLIGTVTKSFLGTVILVLSVSSLLV